MKKVKRIGISVLALCICINILNVFAFGVSAASSAPTDKDWYDVIWSENYESHATEAVDTMPTNGNTTELASGYFKEADGNIALYKTRAVAGEKWHNGGVYFNGDTATVDSVSDGVYVFESKVKYLIKSEMYVTFNAQFVIGGNVYLFQTGYVYQQGWSSEYNLVFDPWGNTKETTGLGKIGIGTDVWYTYRFTFDCNNNKMSVKIKSPSETVYEKTLDIRTCDSTKPVSAQIYCSIGNTTEDVGTTVLFDDAFASKLKNVPLTVNYDTEKGTVTYGGNAVANGAETPVEYNKDAEFTVEAKDGYEVDSVSVDGNPITLNAQGAFTVSKVLSAKTVNVVFKAAEPVAPSVVKTNVISNGTYEGEATAVVYAKVTGEVSETGIVLKDKDGNALTLPAMKDADSKLTSGSFAIRVFGDAMKSGETYKFAPYIEYEGGSYTADDESFVLGQ